MDDVLGIIFKRNFKIIFIFSSSKGNSEEETNSNGCDQFVDCTISPPPDAKNEDEPMNGDDSIDNVE